ncbi:unnamed protein product [Mesocestoides corti]|uniref:Uncharacterized protein n=1 Tax=Mesocestoides corti TaxID=53468 RepID=A0A0R3UDX7_MESCO|nr:unnamed protein product [Mesocestoides corti]
MLSDCFLCTNRFILPVGFDSSGRMPWRARVPAVCTGSARKPEVSHYFRVVVELETSHSTKKTRISLACTPQETSSEGAIFTPTPILRLPLPSFPPFLPPSSRLRSSGVSTRGNQAWQKKEHTKDQTQRAALISQQSHHPPARLPFPNGIEGTGARGSNPGSYSVSVHGEDAYKLTSAKTQRGINQMISIRGGRACVGEARCSGDNSFTYFKLILPNVARDC